MSKVPEYTKRAIKAYQQRKRAQINERKKNGEDIECYGNGDKQRQYVREYYQRNKKLIAIQAKQKRNKLVCMAMIKLMVPETL